jgi:hypothetical protein
MMIVIRCDQCSEPSALKLTFSYTYASKTCDHCSNTHRSTWTFNFCDQECFIKWYSENKVKTKGIPCRSCRTLEGVATGWEFGFESNGPCTACNGKKRVKC